MADPTNTAAPGTGGEESNYLTIALAVGIPCGVLILALALIISVMFYLMCRTSSHDDEAVYVHRRFQGISLEQQRQAQAKKKKRNRGTQRRESGVSGVFNPHLSRSPSSVSAAAQTNPFGLQEWQVRMYGGAGPGGGGGRRGGGSLPDTEETDMSGDEVLERRGSAGFPTGAINPLMVVRGQDHDPGYDTPPRTHTNTHHLHTHTHTHTSRQSHPYPSIKGNRQERPKSEEIEQERPKSEETEQESSSDDSMNPYD